MASRHRNFTRIAGGRFLVTPKWFHRTKLIRGALLDFIQNESVDQTDGLQVCSYREYDEVALYRICKSAGFQTPEKKYCFTNGLSVNREYFDIHIGDFKFPWRIKQRECVTIRNKVSFRKLMHEPEFKNILDRACESKTVLLMMSRLFDYVEDRPIKDS